MILLVMQGVGISYAVVHMSHHILRVPEFRVTELNNSSLFRGNTCIFELENNEQSFTYTSHRPNVLIARAFELFV